MPRLARQAERAQQIERARPVAVRDADGVARAAPAPPPSSPSFSAPMPARSRAAPRRSRRARRSRAGCSSSRPAAPQRRRQRRTPSRVPAPSWRRYNTKRHACDRETTSDLRPHRLLDGAHEAVGRARDHLDGLRIPRNRRLHGEQLGRREGLPARGRFEQRVEPASRRRRRARAARTGPPRGAAARASARPSRSPSMLAPLPWASRPRPAVEGRAAPSPSTSRNDRPAAGGTRRWRRGRVLAGAAGRFHGGYRRGAGVAVCSEGLIGHGHAQQVDGARVEPAGPRLREPELVAGLLQGLLLEVVELEEPPLLFGQRLGPPRARRRDTGPCRSAASGAGTSGRRRAAASSEVM